MSEMINKNDNRAVIHWKLLTGASALALTAYMTTAGVAGAADADRPIVWIDGGWQFEDVLGKGEPFVPPFDALGKANGFDSVVGLQNALGFSYGAQAGISFQPKDSNWTFSASVRYGRAHGQRAHHTEQHVTGNSYQTYISLVLFHNFHSGHQTPTALLYFDGRASNNEKHAIVDFQAGKDVGLGLLGSAVISAGVRYLEESNASSMAVHEAPDFNFQYRKWNQTSLKEQKIGNFYHYSGSTAAREAEFKGIGPSLAWSNATSLAGNDQNGQLLLDWGANAALLFGRQKTRSQRESATHYHYFSKHYSSAGHLHYKPVAKTSASYASASGTRSRRVTVPNLGGFAGLTYRIQNFKASFGYRVDCFFNMIDGGTDTRHTVTRSFNGPYASISIGLGD